MNLLAGEVYTVKKKPRKFRHSVTETELLKRRLKITYKNNVTKLRIFKKYKRNFRYNVRKIENSLKCIPPY